MVGKKTRGRQKIPMEMIKNEGHRFSSFSKRRKGFYSKASEFCLMSKSDIGVVLTSPSGKFFSFFNPSQESITNRFFNQDQAVSQSSQAIDAYSRSKVNELYERINELESHTKVLNETSKMLDLNKPTEFNKIWWESPLDELTLEDVQKYQDFLAGLQNVSSIYIDALSNNGASQDINNNDNDNDNNSF